MVKRLRLNNLQYQRLQAFVSSFPGKQCNAMQFDALCLKIKRMLSVNNGISCTKPVWRKKEANNTGTTQKKICPPVLRHALHESKENVKFGSTVAVSMHNQHISPAPRMVIIGGADVVSTAYAPVAKQVKVAHTSATPHQQVSEMVKGFEESNRIDKFKNSIKVLESPEGAQFLRAFTQAGPQALIPLSRIVAPHIEHARLRYLKKYFSLLEKEVILFKDYFLPCRKFDNYKDLDNFAREHPNFHVASTQIQNAAPCIGRFIPSNRGSYFNARQESKFGYVTNSPWCVCSLKLKNFSAGILNIGCLDNLTPVLSYGSANILRIIIDFNHINEAAARPDLFFTTKDFFDSLTRVFNT